MGAGVRRGRARRNVFTPFAENLVFQQVAHFHRRSQLIGQTSTQNCVPLFGEDRDRCIAAGCLNGVPRATQQFVNQEAQHPEVTGARAFAGRALDKRRRPGPRRGIGRRERKVDRLNFDAQLAPLC